MNAFCLSILTVVPKCHLFSICYKKKLQRVNTRFHPKTTFKPILCPGHAVGELRYICCEDEQSKNKRRDGDGLRCKPHTHYCRSVYELHLLHSRNAKQIGGCRYTRIEIQERLWKNLSDEWLKKNVSGNAECALHHSESCICENGVIGTPSKERKYSEKAKQKNNLIKELRRIKNCRSQAELSKETIAKLIDML